MKVLLICFLNFSAICAAMNILQGAEAETLGVSSNNKELFESSVSGDYSFGVIGHVYGYQNGDGLPSEVFTNNIKQINSLGLDFLIFSGDLIENCNEAEYLKLKAILSQINMPVFVVPGNHDLGKHNKFPIAVGVDLFTGHLGPLFQGFSIHRRDLFLLIDAESEFAKIVGVQKEFIQSQVDSFIASKDYKNLIVIAHPFIFQNSNPGFTKQDRDNIQGNGGPVGSSGDVYRQIISRVESLRDKHSFFIAGNFGYTLSFYSRRLSGKNSIYMGSGISKDGKNNFFLRFDVIDGNVQHSLVPLDNSDFRVSSTIRSRR